MKPFNKQSIKLHEQEFFPFNFFLQLMIKSIWNDKYTNILWNNQLESEILCCNHSFISTISKIKAIFEQCSSRIVPSPTSTTLLQVESLVPLLHGLWPQVRRLPVMSETEVSDRPWDPPPWNITQQCHNSDLIKSSQRYKKMSGKIEIILLYTNTVEPYHLKLYSSKKISYIR